jgi:DNA-binding transcriptional ArsR family regulator
MAEIIAPFKPVEVTFALEPAYNALASLTLLNMADEFSGLADWVYETACELSPQERQTNRIVLNDVSRYLADASWPSFAQWLDQLEQLDATEMRDQAWQAWLSEAREALGDAVPDPTILLSNRTAYLSVVEMLCDRRDEPFDRAMWEEVHRLLTDPPARQALITAHLRRLWEGRLTSEWERQLPALEESVAAFQSLDMSGLTAVEALKRVVLREILPASRIYWLDDVKHMIFIPSVHAGPYLLRMSGSGAGVERLVFGARIPEDVPAAYPALGRSELLMRLNALTNDTRLRILALLAAEGELSTPQIMAQLDLSQSAASRHLEHLTAAGYVSSRRPEATNLYRLNPERIKYTFRALESFLKMA